MDGNREPEEAERAENRSPSDGPVEVEHVTLADGAELEVRIVLPSDKPHFAHGIARLSRESRYFRFLTGKDEFSDKELAYLTEVDGYDHHAIVTYRRLPDGTEEGVGVARFVRSPSRPDAAEVAITVVDEWQRRGVGTLLYERLKAAARERGIRVLCSDVHHTNTAILRLLENSGAEPTVELSGTTLRLEEVI